MFMQFELEFERCLGCLACGFGQGLGITFQFPSPHSAQCAHTFHCILILIAILNASCLKSNHGSQPPQGMLHDTIPVSKTWLQLTQFIKTLIKTTLGLMQGLMHTFDPTIILPLHKACCTIILCFDGTVINSTQMYVYPWAHIHNVSL